MRPVPAMDYLLDALGYGQERRVAASSLSAGDWSEFVRLAGSLRIAPLLYRRLTTREPVEPIPPDVRAALQRFYYASTSTNERLLHQLGRVLSALNQNEIKVMTLKGAHLASLVYGEPALRPMTDIDLLVREHDLPAAAAALSGSGYARDEGHEDLGWIPAPHVRYLRSDSRIPLEIHWHIAEEGSPLAVDLDGLWERARPAAIAGVKTVVLSPEDLLLHLCMHAAFHHSLGSNGIRSLCDIAEVIRHHGDAVDWPQLVQRSRAWRAGHAVYLTLQMAATLLHAAVPEPVLSELKPIECPDRIVQWAEEQLLSDPAAGAGPPSDSWGKVYAAAGPAARVRAVLQALFPLPGTLARKYSVPANAPTIYRYYPVHLRDLCRDHARRAWRLWRGDPASRAWAQRERRRIEEQNMRRWMTAG